MSTFKNVSGVDLDLYVDGRPHAVDADGTVTVADEFDYQLADQPAWEQADQPASPPVDTAKPATYSAPVVPVSVPEPATPDTTPTDEASASEGAN